MFESRRNAFVSMSISLASLKNALYSKTLAECIISKTGIKLFKQIYSRVKLASYLYLIITELVCFYQCFEYSLQWFCRLNAFGRYCNFTYVLLSIAHPLLEPMFLTHSIGMPRRMSYRPLVSGFVSYCDSYIAVCTV